MIREVPSEFLALGWRSFWLLLLAGLFLGTLASLFALLAGSALVTALSWALLLGMVGGVIGVLFLFFAIRRGYYALAAHFDAQLEYQYREPPAVAPTTPALPASAPKPPSTAPSLNLETSNRINADYDLSLKVLAVVLNELAKEKDGRKLKHKPHSYDRLHEAGYVDKWEDWNRLVTWWERAGIGEHLLDKSGWSFSVSNVHDAEQCLKTDLKQAGMMLVNGEWVRK